MNKSEALEAKKKSYKINDFEYQRILELLGREPQGVEWGLFSALWSEHCSYKSSKVHLKKLFTKSSRVVTGVGENAGVVDLGEGERVAFKIESHNHPSYIEPYQGAATGVGGIIRDILTMGARPIALGNYLCFGETSAPRMRTLVDGVVRGIGGYGNCVGVPMLTGETQFDSTYNGNILVNAMCVGYFGPGEKVASAIASGPGNLVVYVGAKTGKDGIHGARMASESFGQNDADKRPNVQIGDPFLEKLLIESCLEVIQRGLVVAIQDMGAAGLISSSFEMASKGGVGFELHLDQVPLRDSTMSPEDVLVSESQERMLLICEPYQLPEIKKIYERWGLDAVEIGKITKERLVKIFWKNEKLSEIDPDLLVENAPRYERPFELPSKSINRVDWREGSRVSVVDAGRALHECLKHSQGCDRSPVYRQYDQRVGAQTVADCGNSFGVVALPSGRSLGIALGGRPHVMRFDPYVGGIDSIIYPALKMAAHGFDVTAVSDGLNYGNPEKPNIMGEFVAQLNGMDESCRALEAPIISGNVSFYNETQGRNITSTPMTVLVGVKDSVERVSEVFHPSCAIYLVRDAELEFGGLFAGVRGAEVRGHGSLNPKRLGEFVRNVASISRSECVTSARVVGKFGLAYTLAKMCLSGTGATCDLDLAGPEELFSERLYEVVMVVDIGSEGAFEQVTRNMSGLSVVKIGSTGGATLRINDLISVGVEQLRESWQEGGKVTFEGMA